MAVSDVGQPHLKRKGRNDVAVQVREDRQIVIAVGGLDEASAPIHPQSMGLHHPRDALEIDVVTASAKLVRETAIAVDR